MTNKRILYTRIVKCAILLLLLTAALLAVTHVLERKDAQIAKAEFYTAGEQYDVLFFGTSRMMNGILPMELWADYGLTSYNLSGHAQYLPVTYWVLKDALERAKPRVVVVDIFAAGATDKVYTADMAYLHNSLDAMPLCSNKLQAVWDLLPAGASRMEYLFDFTLYHSRWEELTKADFRIPYSLEKGAESRIHVYPMQAPQLAEQETDKTQAQTGGGETMGILYLRRIIELCQSKDCEILLVNLPHYADIESQQIYHYVNEIAREYNITYIDYLTRERMDTIHFETDIYDEESHLNPSGARKVTKDVGGILTAQYLKEGCEKPDKVKSAWQQAYSTYRRELLERMQTELTLADVMMLCADESISVSIEIAAESDYDNNEAFLALTANLKEQARDCRVTRSEKLSHNEVKMWIRDDAVGETIECFFD